MAKRHRDHDALAHPAGELVRVAGDRALRPGCPTGQQSIARRARRRALGREIAHRLDDLLRRSCRTGFSEVSVLEDHRDLAAAESAHLLVGHRGEVVAVETRLAARDAASFLQQPHDRQRGDAFARARFADEPSVSPRYLEAHAVDRAHDAGVGVEVRAQVADVEERCASAWRGCTRSPTSRPHRRRIHRRREVEPVTHAIAEEVEAHHDRENREARERRAPPLIDQLAALGDHRVPIPESAARRRGRGTRARRRRGRLADVERHQHDRSADRIRRMWDQDAPGLSRRCGGFDISWSAAP